MLTPSERPSNDVHAIRPTTWDHWGTHRQLIGLTRQRCVFRFRRMIGRYTSPRHWLSTALSVAFFAAYLMYGVLVLSSREPAGSDRLRLWLSGGMVLYVLYHSMKCVWASRIDDLELTAAESLWLGGAPLQRSTLAVFHLLDVVNATAMKTLLLSVVLYVDVTYVPILLLALFVSLLQLEAIRLILQRVRSGLSSRELGRVRTGASLVVVAAGLLFLTRLIEKTPYGSPPVFYFLHAFHSLGDLAATPIIQTLAFPWFHSSRLAVVDSIDAASLGLLMGTLAVIPLSILLLVRTDRWANLRRREQDTDRLTSHRTLRADVTQVDDGNVSVRPTTFDRVEGWLNRCHVWPVSAPAFQQFIAVVVRQGISIRRYKGEISFSLLMPTLLCLSPLLTDHTRQPWFFVVGGIVMCTVLLAPPALRLDFRRDLKRMLLLRGLPVSATALVLGQVFLPVLVTVCFQALVLLTAASVLQVGWYQATFWAVVLPSVAIVTFALENTLFLLYPHHEKTQGIAMMLRTKLMFLGKTTLILLGVAALMTWSLLTKSLITPAVQPVVLLSGVTFGMTLLALVCLASTRWAWTHFDLSSDLPPE